MDCGIEDDYIPQDLSVFDYRLQVYQRWIIVRKKRPRVEAKTFCRRQGIPFESLGTIVREIEDLDPTGERWGK